MKHKLPPTETESIVPISPYANFVHDFGQVLTVRALCQNKMLIMPYIQLKISILNSLPKWKSLKILNLNHTLRMP